jgi:uncharacterized protein (TIGR00251 family)
LSRYGTSWRRTSSSVKPNAKFASVTKLSETEYRVTVHAPAKDAKANRALIGLRANYFHVPKLAIIIVRGEFARKKLVKVGE